MGLRFKGCFKDADPLNKVPLKRVKSRVKKGLLSRVSLILPRKFGI